jgi:hypothetical protein
MEYDLDIEEDRLAGRLHEEVKTYQATSTIQCLRMPRSKYTR